jgi:putative ABC transport system permease protein
MSLLVIATLVFGIGVNTAIFSVVNAVLLRPVPIKEPEKVLWIFPKVKQTGAPAGGISYPEYLDWKTQASSFEAITVLRAFSFYFSGSGLPENLKGTGISESGFKVFGVRTILGRGFTEGDDRPEAERTVILNYPFWQRKFGGNRNILGKSISLDDESYTIIGVLQPTHLGVLQYPDVWVPNALFLDQRMQSRESRYYFPTARLKSSVSEAQAQSEMETIAARLAAQYPNSNKDIGVRFLGLVEYLSGNSRTPLTLLLAASGLIFVLACVNILIVVLSGTAERRKELGIRLALGARRFDVLRQMFIQAFMLVGTGSVLGLGLTKLGLVYFLLRFPQALLRFQETTIDYRVIGFMIALAFLTMILATAVPAWYASRLNIMSDLKGESIGSPFAKFRTLRQGTLIIFEVTLASALSLTCGLMIKSFYEVARIDLGFSPHQILSFQINLPKRYKDADQSAFYRRAVDNLSTIPGLSVASGIETLPLTTQGNVMTLQADAQSPLSAERPLVEYDSILPGLFTTMTLPILQGRDFTSADQRNTTPVVIIDEMLAAKFWPGQSPLGKHLRLFEVADGKSPWREVVGVTKQMKHFGPEAKIQWMQVYIPEYQEPTPVLSFVLNTRLSEAVVKAAAEKTIHELDGGLPVENFQCMDALLDGYLASRKLSLLLLGAFAAIALLLRTIGIYGVIVNSVVRRRREIAIRMALGSSRLRTIILVTKLGLLSTLAGLLLGVALVLSLIRTLSSFLFGVKALTPGIYLVTIGTIIVLALAATLTPAMSVLKLDPQNILRD